LNHDDEMALLYSHLSIVSLQLFVIARLLQCTRLVMLVVCNPLFTYGSLQLFVCSVGLPTIRNSSRLYGILVLSRKCKPAFPDSMLSGKSKVVVLLTSFGCRAFVPSPCPEWRLSCCYIILHTS